MARVLILLILLLFVMFCSTYAEMMGPDTISAYGNRLNSYQNGQPIDIIDEYDPEQGKPRRTRTTEQPTSPTSPKPKIWIPIVAVVGIIIILAGIGTCFFWRWWVKRTGDRDAYIYDTLAFDSLATTNTMTQTIGDEGLTELPTEADLTEADVVKPKGKPKGKGKMGITKKTNVKKAGAKKSTPKKSTPKKASVKKVGGKKGKK